MWTRRISTLLARGVEDAVNVSVETIGRRKRRSTQKVRMVTGHSRDRWYPHVSGSNRRGLINVRCCAPARVNGRKGDKHKSTEPPTDIRRDPKEGVKARIQAHRCPIRFQAMFASSDRPTDATPTVPRLSPKTPKNKLVHRIKHAAKYDASGRSEGMLTWLWLMRLRSVGCLGFQCVVPASGLSSSSYPPSAKLR
jgi:hypothetical protein